MRSTIAREITIEGDIRLKVGLAPTLIAGPVKLRNADWGSRPDMLTVDEVELQIGLLALLSKKIVFKNLVLVKPDVWVEQKADGRRNNWQFDETPAEQPPPSPQTASTPYEVHLEAVKIQDGSLILHDLKTGEINRIQITTLTLDRKAGPLPLKIALEGGYNQAAIAVEGDISLFSDLLTTSKDWAFDLAIKSAQSELTLAGRLQRSSGDAPPRLEATVKGPKLDVRPWLSDAPEADLNVQKTNRVFPNTPLPFDILHDLELQADIDIQEFLMPHMALQNVKTPIQIKEGRLDLGPARANAGGGDYQAHLKIDARAKPPGVKAALKINQMNTELMLKELGLSNMIEGVVDFQADLEGQGASMAKLMGSLNGHAMLVSGEGQLGKLFFGLFDEGIASQLVTLFNPLEKRSTTTPIECLVIRFDSKGGVARLSQMIWVTPDSIVVGGGQIDLATEKIDIGIQPTPKRGQDQSRNPDQTVPAGRHPGITRHADRPHRHGHDGRPDRRGNALRPDRHRRGLHEHRRRRCQSLPGSRQDRRKRCGHRGKRVSEKHRGHAAVLEERMTMADKKPSPMIWPCATRLPARRKNDNS